MNKFWIVILGALILVGCSNPTEPPPTLTPTPTVTLTPTSTLTPTPTPTGTWVPDPPVLPVDLSGVGVITTTRPLTDFRLFGYTHQLPDGNRFPPGSLDLELADLLKISLDGKPLWVVGGPVDGGSIWAVALEDGTIQGFHIISGIVTEIQLLPGKLVPGQPPLLQINRGVPSILTAPGGDPSPLTHPIVITGTNTTAFVENNGDLVLWENGERFRFAINALPDARILQDEVGNLMVLSGATGIYGHGVLGDAVEASSISIIDVDPNIELVRTIEMPENTVIEGIAPIWTDLDGDGRREIIVTLANETVGAYIAVYSEKGEIIALGDPAGRGFRWRHQIAVAPLGALTRLSLVDTLTPHIGGIVEYMRLDGTGAFTLDFTHLGNSSHQLGSGNLDMALVADLFPDFNNQIELLLPTQDYLQLQLVGQVGSTLEDFASFDLDGRLTTNLAGVTFPNGTLAIAAGTERGTLYIWGLDE